MKSLHNYKQEVKTIDMMKANIFSLILIIPAFLLFGIPYSLIWGFDEFSEKLLTSFQPFGNGSILDFILEMVYLGIGVILHELIHGLTWSLFAKSKLKSIQFGFFWRMLSPYCFCKEPLKLNHYRIGVFMPTIFVSILPGIIAIWLGKPDLLIFSAFMMIVSSGDFLILNLLKKESKDSYFLDKPIECGGILLRLQSLNKK